MVYLSLTSSAELHRWAQPSSMQSVGGADNNVPLIFNFNLDARSWLAGDHALMRDIVNAKLRFLFDSNAIGKASYLPHRW